MNRRIFGKDLGEIWVYFGCVFGKFIYKNNDKKGG